MRVIYKIEINNKVYIGSSKNYSSRISQHLKMLTKGNHHSSKLQDAYNKYGITKVSNSVLEEVVETKNILTREKYWITEYDSVENGYNMVNVKAPIAIEHLKPGTVTYRKALLRDKLNPLAKSLVIKKKNLSVPLETEVSEDGSVIRQYRLIEYNSSVKIYSSPHLREVVMSLTPSACVLFNWIPYLLRDGEDYVYINKKRALKEVGISDKTFRNNMQELYDKELLLSTEQKNIYWFNPSYFFKGDRLKKYPEKIVYI